MAVDENKLRTELRKEMVAVVQSMVPEIVTRMDDPRISKIQDQLKILIGAVNATNPAEWLKKTVDEATKVLAPISGLKPEMIKDLLEALPRWQAIGEELKREWNKKIPMTKGQLFEIQVAYLILGVFIGVVSTLVYLKVLV